MPAYISNILASVLICCVCTVNAAELSFEFVDPQDFEQKMIEVLAEQDVLRALTNFSNQNFQLQQSTTFKFYPGEGLFFDAHENDVYIPYAYLVQLYKGAKNRYPQQGVIFERIFASAVEQLLWFEFSRVLVSQYSMPLRGNEELVLDEFATLMLLNFSDLAESYILDAMEAYLFVSDSNSLLYGDSWQSEEIVDKKRYAQTVCLVLGKDANGQIFESDLHAWTPERIASCKALYLYKLNAWYEVLQPYLLESSPLHELANEPNQPEVE